MPQVTQLVGKETQAGLESESRTSISSLTILRKYYLPTIKFTRSMLFNVYNKIFKTDDFQQEISKFIL